MFRRYAMAAILALGTLSGCTGFLANDPLTEAIKQDPVMSTLVVVRDTLVEVRKEAVIPKCEPVPAPTQEAFCQLWKTKLDPAIVGSLRTAHATYRANANGVPVALQTLAAAQQAISAIDEIAALDNDPKHASIYTGLRASVTAAATIVGRVLQERQQRAPPAAPAR